MDLQKERALFESWLIDKFNIKTDSCDLFLEKINEKYARDFAQTRWETWVEAKSQAIPEGFVLVPKEPTQEMMIAALAVISTGIGKNHIDVEIIQCWKKMIESQEPTHD